MDPAVIGGLVILFILGLFARTYWCLHRQARLEMPAMPPARRLEDYMFRYCWLCRIDQAGPDGLCEECERQLQQLVRGEAAR
jgi:hypothetical protein